MDRSGLHYSWTLTPTATMIFDPDPPGRLHFRGWRAGSWHLSSSSSPQCSLLGTRNISIMKSMKIFYTKKYLILSMGDIPEYWIFSKKKSFRNELHTPFYLILIPNTPYVKFLIFFILFVGGYQKLMIYKNNLNLGL